MEFYLTKRLLQSSSSSEEESDLEHRDKEAEELKELKFLNNVVAKVKRTKQMYYVNNVINEYSDMDFQTHFRITRSSFEVGNVYP